MTTTNEPTIDWYALGAALGRGMSTLGALDINLFAQGFASGRELGIIATDNGVDIAEMPWLDAIVKVADVVRPADARQYVLTAGSTGKFGTVDLDALATAVLA